MKLHDRIEMREGVLGGKPVIEGTRISVELVLKQLAGGLTIAQVLENYPHLKQEDILACLDFAAEHFTAERYATVLATHL
jgi:uncharacterized protein (DUF433 family)